jgi:hypothetical protein
MSYFRQLDILVELIDLCQDIIADLRQKLSFYRASVYKIENHNQIRASVEDLAVVLKILGDKDLSQFWSSFHSHFKETPPEGEQRLPPGESHFSFQLGIFLCGIDQALSDYYHQITTKTDHGTEWLEMLDMIRFNRQTLLALCKNNSKQYHFLQSL